MGGLIAISNFFSLLRLSNNIKILLIDILNRDSNEQEDHLMVKDYRRPWTLATPEELFLCCILLRDRNLKVYVRKSWANFC